jgi:hypothetical protein
MNTGQYYEAGAKVLNWKWLSPNMKARYGAWKVLSDGAWSHKWKVTVTHHNGKKLKQVYTYPFGSEADANVCRQWWTENGCQAVVEVIS